MEQLKDRETNGDSLDTNPIALSENYLRNVRKVSDRQVLIEGVRLANTLCAIGTP